MPSETHNFSQGQPGSEKGVETSNIVNALLKFVFPIYMRMDKQLIFICSGFVIHWRGRYFVVTAAHAISEFKLSKKDPTIGIDNSYFPINTVHSIDTNTDESYGVNNLDIGAWEINPNTPFFQNIKNVSIDEALLLRQYIHGPDGDLIVCGFPNSINKKVKRDTLAKDPIVNAIAYGYRYSEAIDFDYEAIKKDKNRHIAINWERRDIIGNETVYPRGLSGAPVWSLQAVGPNYVARLAGIFIEYHRPYGVAISTKIDMIIQILDFIYPTAIDEASDAAV